MSDACQLLKALVCRYKHTHTHTHTHIHTHTHTHTYTHSESLQGLGFTLILDMSHASWLVTKKSLKALQLTFVEHIHQVLVVKPKAFWQRRKVGVSFTLKKSKYNFPVGWLVCVCVCVRLCQSNFHVMSNCCTPTFNHTPSYRSPCWRLALIYSTISKPPKSPRTSEEHWIMTTMPGLGNKRYEHM